MILKYYIGAKPGTDGNYTIHSQGCPLLPDPGRRVLIGIFRSPPDALKRGIMFHARLAVCPFCLKSNKDINTPDCRAGESGTELILSAKLKTDLTDVLICAVN